MKKDPYIAIIYHRVDKRNNVSYHSRQHRIIDNDTGHVVRFVHSVFIKEKIKSNVIPIYNFQDLKSIDFEKYTCIFNLIDSKDLENKALKYLDTLAIPHTGSSYKTITKCNSKLEMKKIFRRGKIRTPRWMIVKTNQKIKPDFITLEYPIIVKPIHEHCSVGISNTSIAENYFKLSRVVSKMQRQFNQPLLLEEFIFGREFHITVAENGKRILALPLAELSFNDEVRNPWNIYGFDEKWSKRLQIYKSCYFISPPLQLSKTIQNKILSDARFAFKQFGYNDYGRFDIRYNPNSRRWYFLDANANACLDPSPREAIPTSIKASGISMSKFIVNISLNAMRRAS